MKKLEININQNNNISTKSRIMNIFSEQNFFQQQKKIVILLIFSFFLESLFVFIWDLLCEFIWMDDLVCDDNLIVIPFIGNYTF